MDLGIKKFVDNNRQLRSTTSLIKAAKDVDGYLIVSHSRERAAIIYNHPDFIREPRQLFIDAALLCYVT